MFPIASADLRSVVLFLTLGRVSASKPPRVSRAFGVDLAAGSALPERGKTHTEAANGYFQRGSYKDKDQAVQVHGRRSAGAGETSQ